VAKKDENKQLPKFEDYLAPWEVDGDGKKLDEPAELDPARLKKHLYNLLSDKTRLQETVADKDTEVAQAQQALKDLQTQHENEDQRKERENKEREDRLAKAEAREQERAKIDAIAEEFEEQGITSAQAKRLAKRVSGENEKDWIADARELVEDNFKVGVKPATAETDDSTDDDLSVRPVPRRGNGSVSEPKTGKAKSVREQMEEANLFRDEW
jgi:hypothetical protein